MVIAQDMMSLVHLDDQVIEKNDNNYGMCT